MPAAVGRRRRITVGPSMGAREREGALALGAASAHGRRSPRQRTEMYRDLPWLVQDRLQLLVEVA